MKTSEAHNKLGEPQHLQQVSSYIGVTNVLAIQHQHQHLYAECMIYDRSITPLITPLTIGQDHDR